jgi:hypothetical protein
MNKRIAVAVFSAIIALIVPVSAIIDINIDGENIIINGEVVQGSGGTLENLEYVTDHRLTVSTSFAASDTNRLSGIYTGPLVNGVPHGRGVFVHVNATVNPTPQTAQWYYEGDFYNGTFHGQGRYYANGRLQHAGRFERGNPKGFSEEMTELYWIILIVVSVIVVPIIMFTIIVKINFARQAKANGMTTKEWAQALVQAKQDVVEAVAQTVINITLDNEDEDEPILVTARCCGCNAATNITKGTSAICKFCGNAVLAAKKSEQL